MGRKRVENEEERGISSTDKQHAEDPLLSESLPPSVQLSQKQQELKQLDILCTSELKLLRKNGEFGGQRSNPELEKLKRYYRKQRRVHYLRRLLRGSIVICGMAFILSFMLFSKPGNAVFRIALAKILPYWDWSFLQSIDCFLPNYIFEDAPPSDAHCAICDDMSEIMQRRSGEIGQFYVGEDFLVEDVPLILRGAFNVLSGPVPLSLKVVLEHHRSDDTLEPCKLLTNIRTKSSFRFDAVLRKISRDDLQLPWFAMWELCKHNNAREARAIVPRPPELPLMLEIVDSVWFFLSRNFSAVSFKKIEISTPIFWISQIAGSSRIRLVPKGICHNICREMEADLLPGDLLLMTNELFNVGWMPGREAETLSVGAGAK